MTILGRLVLGWCLAAALTALAWSALEDTSAPEAHAGGDPAPEVGGDPSRSLVTALRSVAVTARALPTAARVSIVDRCFTLPEGADPALSPAADEVELVATGTTTGAAVVVWTGRVPGVGRAIGSCVGVDRVGYWQLTNRLWRSDPGPGVSSLAWNQYASAEGAAAALVGRVAPGTREVLVELADGRVLHQATDGFVALAWVPVVPPVRLVVIDEDGDVTREGPVSERS